MPKADFYQVKQNPAYNNFMVGMDLIQKCKAHNNILKFVYVEDGETITKYVDMTVVGCKLQPPRQMPNGIDEETGEQHRRGLAFPLPAEVIYAYDDSAFRKKIHDEATKSDWEALASMGIIVSKK